MTVVLVIVVEVIGIVHLGALIVVLIIVEQAALGSVAADALGLGILAGLKNDVCRLTAGVGDELVVLLARGDSFFLVVSASSRLSWIRLPRSSIIERICGQANLASTTR